MCKDCINYPLIKIKKEMLLTGKPLSELKFRIQAGILLAEESLFVEIL